MSYHFRFPDLLMIALLSHKVIKKVRSRIIFVCTPCKEQMFSVRVGIKIFLERL
jgi:hypothetical protein